MNNIKQKQMYTFLIVLTVSCTMGLFTWRTLFNNFAVETAGLSGEHVGMIQSVREIPGFLAFLLVFILLIIKEHRLAALSIILLGIGVAVTGLFPTYWGLLITTFAMSFGFHYYQTISQSLTLQYFDKTTSPWILGRLRSFASLSNIVAGILVYLLAFVMGYVEIYLVMGGLILIAGIWGYIQDPSDFGIPPQRIKIVLRRKYWLFYFITFMGGARRQIFIVFAVLLLVEKFEYTIQAITVLFILNNIIGYFLNPLIGKAIIRFGERKVLSMEYFSLIIIFLAYAMVKSWVLPAVLYILDHVFFSFSMAIQTYFQKIGDTEDIAPSMAAGTTINHIAAVVIPAICGIMWMVDYRLPFVIGAGMSLVSLIIVQLIHVPEQS